MLNLLTGFSLNLSSSPVLEPLIKISYHPVREIYDCVHEYHNDNDKDCVHEYHNHCVHDPDQDNILKVNLGALLLLSFL